MIKLISILFSLTVFIFSAHGKEFDELGMGLGMSMISFQEIENELTGDNISEKTSGSYSVITTNLYWKFFHRRSYSLYVNALFPIVSATGSSVLGGGLGFEYYFTRENSILKERQDNLTLSITPKLRYYLIAEANLMFLSYLTEESKKNDINIELVGGAGTTYSFSGNWTGWGVRGSGKIGRGLGAIASSLNFNLHGSIIYYLD